MEPVYFSDERSGQKIPVDGMNEYQAKLFLTQLIKEKEKTKFLTSDPVVNEVITKLAQRSEVGVRKYNCDLTREDLSRKDWFAHLQHELLDAVNYIQVLLRS